MILGTTVLEFQSTGWFLIRGMDLRWTTELKKQTNEETKNVHMYTPTCPMCTHLGSENCPHFKGRLKMHCIVAGTMTKCILGGGVRYGRFD